MGVTLRHSVKIDAAPDKVFHALTDTNDIATWHMGSVEGKVAPGDVLFLDSKPGLRFGWKTKELVPNQKLEQECVEGPGSSVGKTLSFTLTPDGNGTIVDLTDGEWKEGDPSLPYCNTHWGGVLHRLKSHLDG